MIATSVKDKFQVIYSNIKSLNSNGKDRLYYHHILAEIKKEMGPDCATIFSNNVKCEDGMYWIDSDDDVNSIWKRMMKVKTAS